MKRYAIFLGLLSLGGATSAAAQSVALYPLDSYGFSSDTAFTIALGRTRSLYLYGSVTGGVSSYSITVFFDTNRVRIAGVDSVPGTGLPAPSVTPLANGATLTASGAGALSSYYLATLDLEMQATATSGSLLSLRVNQVTNQAGGQVQPWTLTTSLLNTCLARVLWGDPDSSLTVTGRDALIALTSAVQLPVTGFDLSVADVDADFAVTSRDALLMLSYAVSGSTNYYYERTGIPVAGACAPFAGVPSDMVFLRGTAANNLYRVAAGDTVAVPVGSSTAFATSHFVRWSPDGTKVLGTAGTLAYYTEPIAVTLATLVEDTLARNANYDGGGTYSPDGTQIAFFSTRASPYLFLMGADGANPVQAQTAITVTNYSATNPAWSPDGQRVAFTGIPPTGGANGLWTVVVADGTTQAVFPASATYPPLHPTWSPAGDSLAFAANNRIYAVAAPADTTTVPRPVVTDASPADTPTWTSAGLVFRLLRATSQPYTYDYYLRQPDGRVVRIFRAAGTDDVGASFR